MGFGLFPQLIHLDGIMIMIMMRTLACISVNNFLNNFLGENAGLKE